MTHKCARCDWRGDEEEAEEHARETGHLRCVVCQQRSLTEFEPQACSDCVADVRDALATAGRAYADLHEAFTESSYRGIRAEILAILGDGSTQGGGPDDDIRYHDPCSAAAQLERLERDWREVFGHGTPNYPPLGAGKWQSRRPLHVYAEASTYLTTWLTLASRTHPAFDEDAREIRDLAFRLELAAGEVNFPRRDPIPCQCGGKLVQDYIGDSTEPKGKRGLTEERRCRDCGTVYKPDDYAWHVRMKTDTPGWISLEQAATRTGRPIVTLKAWAASLVLPTICHRLTRRVLVNEDVVETLHEDRATRRRAG